MKIALFTDLFAPQISGIVTHIIDIARILSQDHKIMIFAPRPSHEDINSKKNFAGHNIKIIDVPSAPLPLYKNLRITLPHNPFIFDILNTYKPDIIHFHTPGTVSINGILYAKNKHVPLVGTFHGYFMEPEYLSIIGLDKLHLHKSKSINLLLWKYAQFFYNVADQVICPSVTTKNDLLAHGITKPVHIISNGIQLKLATNNKKAGKNYILPESFFLHVGRISKEKSIPDLIKAFKKCAKLIPADLVIVGDGPVLNEIKEITNQLHLDDRVHFMGELHHDKLLNSNIYKEALSFITPSTSETQGIAILEAMAAKLPIIGVKARAVPELISDNGICCKPHNMTELSQAMVTLYTHKDMRVRFGQNSYKNAKKHAIEKTVRSLIHVYSDMTKLK